MLLSAAVGAWLVDSADGTLRSATLLLVAPAPLLLAVALGLRLPIGIPAGIVLLGTAYTLRLLTDESSLDETAPIVAAAFYVLAELSHWSLEARAAIAGEAGVELRRIGLLAGIATGTVVLGVALLALADVAGTSGITVEAVGAGAAVGAVGLLVYLSRPAP